MLTGQKKLKFFESFFLTAEQLFEIMSEVDQSQLGVSTTASFYPEC